MATRNLPYVDNTFTRAFWAGRPAGTWYGAYGARASSLGPPNAPPTALRRRRRSAPTVERLRPPTDLLEPNGRPAPRCSKSSCSPTSSEPAGSASSGGYPESRTYAELLTDCEEDRTLRAVLVGMLREAAR
jgi:hypothetical protein